MKYIFIFLMLAFLSGCLHVPANLTEPCPVYKKKNESVDESIRLANSRLDSIEKCNEKLAEIRKRYGEK